MYCPVCHCEYVPRITVCPDCQVALVAELSETPEEISQGDAPWTMIWSGGDPRRQEELCAALEEEKIPARTSLEGGLLNLAAYASFDVYVPAPLVPKATEVLREIALAEEEWRRNADAGALALPEDEDPPEPDASEFTSEWYPEDATSEIWSGENSDLAAMIVASLRENKIRFRADQDAGKGSAAKIFVLPEDDVRAKKIVRQIVDAVAP